MADYSIIPDSGNSDDGYWAIVLPFNISFLGTSYNTVYVGTNSYITFGSGSTAWSSLGAGWPQIPKIHLGARDNSAQRISWTTRNVSPNRAFTIRYEGTIATSGILGSPNLVWEATFYEASYTEIDVQFLVSPTTTLGVSGVYTAWTTPSIYSGTLSTIKRNVQRIHTTLDAAYISDKPAPSKTLYMSGAAGAILIGSYGIDLGSDGHSGAVTDPLAYANNLYFHSSLRYSQINGKAIASTLTFSGVTRNYTEWDESSKSGGCFITTACVKYNSELDNGKTLTTLRSFRDNYMLKRSDVAELVEYYYNMAPECVEKLENSADPAKVFNILYTEYILPAVDNINAGNNEAALSIYIDGIKAALSLAEQI